MIQETNIKKIVWLYPLLLFAANLILKLLYFTSQDISLDEPFSIYHAQFNVGTIVSQLKNYNNPPLFELLLHYWIGLFGISPEAVRVLPLLFAALAPVALFYFGKRFFSLSAGIVSSLLLSFSSLLVFYAHDCRVYSLFLLLSILSMHYFLALLQEQGSAVKNAACFILLSSLLIYAHYFGCILLFFQGLYLLLFYRQRIKLFFLCYGMMLLLYAPHLYPLVVRMHDSVARGTWLNPPNGVESLYNMLWSFSNAPVITVGCLLLLAGGGVKFLFSENKVVEKTTVLVLIWFLLAYVGMFFLSYRVPMYISRYLIFVLPAYYLLLHVCIAFLFQAKRLRNSVWIMLVAGFALSTDWDPDKKQALSAGVNMVKQFKNAGTLVIVAPRDFLPAFAYYYDPHFFSDVHDQQEYQITDSLLQTNNVRVINTSAGLAALNISGYSRIVYFGNGGTYAGPQSDILQALAASHQLAHTKRFNNNYGVSVLVKKKK